MQRPHHAVGVDLRHPRVGERRGGIDLEWQEAVPGQRPWAAFVERDGQLDRRRVDRDRGQRACSRSLRSTSPDFQIPNLPRLFGVGLGLQGAVVHSSGALELLEPTIVQLRT
jgi:hypothetical protein